MRSACIIPTYNCRTTIGDVVRQASLHVDHVFVIDDGSTDDTPEQAKTNGAAVLRHQTNLGKGTALVSGFARVLQERFDIVVTIDGDGENDPNDIPTLIHRLAFADADAALGCRTRTHCSLLFGFKLTKAILDDFLGIILDDAMCGLRAYRSRCLRAILPCIRSTGFGIDLEIVLLLLLRSAALIEVPVSGSNLTVHEGVKSSHILAFFRNLKIYSPLFGTQVPIDLTRLIRTVEEQDDFEFRLNNTTKKFRYDKEMGLYR